MGRLVGGIGNNDLYLWMLLRYLVIYLVKGHAVMDIAGSHDCLQHETILVAGSMGFIRKLPLVLALYE